MRRRHALAVAFSAIPVACSSGGAHVQAPKAREAVQQPEAESPAPTATAAEEVVEPGGTGPSPSPDAPGPTTTVPEEAAPRGGGTAITGTSAPAVAAPSDGLSTTTIPANSIAAGPLPVSVEDLLACIRSYEQGPDGYATDTGNGYYGAYQFDLDTWASVGGTGNPAHASPEEQDARAASLLAERGLQPWPTPARRCR